MASTYGSKRGVPGYDKFKTGLSYQDAYAMLWVDSENQDHWKQKSNGQILRIMHEVKVAMFEQATGINVDTGVQLEPSRRMTMKTMNPALIYFIPTAIDVSDLRVGDRALDCFGKWRTVAKIGARSIDVNGAAFVRFETEFGPSSTMTGSYKVGELVRTTALSAAHTSAEVDAIERELNARAGSLRKTVETPAVTMQQLVGVSS
jgi:hypothetical protein